MIAVDQVLARARSRANLPPPNDRKRLRTRFGLTLEDVADAIGVTAATVSRYETGTRFPRRTVIPQYVDLLGRLQALESEEDERLAGQSEPFITTDSAGTGRRVES